MSAIQVTVPLQVMCHLIIAGQVAGNRTLPSIQNSSLAETTDSPVLPSGYVEFPEIGFAYKLLPEWLTYNEARKKCLNEKGQLAVIDSREKVEEILNYFSTGDYMWAGLVRSCDIEEWTTVDGKSTSNLPWARGEPSGDYTCAYLSRDSGPLRSDACETTSNYVLCEIALPTK